MLALLWLKIQKYVYAAGAIILAIGGAILYGREKGKASQEAKTDVANEKAQTAEQTTAIVESRHDTDAEVQKLPDAPAQTVGTADPATAAGKLSQFTRD